MEKFENRTPEEREQLKQKRDRGLYFLKKICIMTIGVSAVSFVVGIVALGFAAPNPKFPYIMAAPIWSAIFAAVAASCGLMAEKNGIDKLYVESKVKNYVTAFYLFNTLCIAVILFTGMPLVFGVMMCLSTKPDFAQNCKPNTTALLATTIASAVVEIILAVQCTVNLCHFCYYGKSLGFKSKHELRRERRLKEMQMDDIGTETKPLNQD